MLHILGRDLHSVVASGVCSGKRKKGFGKGRRMSHSDMEEEEAPDVICELENVQGLVDALTAVRWKRHQVIITTFSPTPPFFFFKLTP